MIDAKEQPEIDIEVNIESVLKRNWKNQISREKFNNPFKNFQDITGLLPIYKVSDEDNRTKVSLCSGKDVSNEIINSNIRANHIDTDLWPEWYPTEPDGDTFVVGDTENVISEMITALENDNQEKQLELIGAPPCCAKFNDDYEGNDPVYDSACNSESAEEHPDHDVIVKDPHDILNPFWRQHNLRFIDYIPCSLECDEARNHAIDNGKVIRDRLEGGDETPDLVYEFLAEPAAWSGYNHLTNIRNKDLIGSYVTDPYWEKCEVIWKEEHDPKRV